MAEKFTYLRPWRLDQREGCSEPWGEAETPVLSQDIKSGRSPLIHAVENNSLNMVQLLLLVSTVFGFVQVWRQSSVASIPGMDAIFQFRPWLLFCP